MSNIITLKQVKERLENFGEAYEEIRLNDNFSIILTKRGGRILGPFKNEDSSSVLWINKAFSNDDAFRNFIDEKDWNVGGERVWVLPEMPFFVEDRSNFFDTYVIQEALDPGNFSLEKKDNVVTLNQKVRLDTFQIECKERNFLMDKSIKCEGNPLAESESFSELMDSVSYCGFSQTVFLKDLDEKAETYLETWFLTQIKPEGKLIVPYEGELGYIDYYEPVEDEYYKIDENKMTLKVTGDKRYKVGFMKDNMTGCSGYMSKTDEGEDYLFIRKYKNDPENIYCGDPSDRPELYGCSLYLFNDSGALGGFAEYENGCTTISGDTDKREATDTVNYYFYFGTKEKLEKIAEFMLGDK